MKRLLQFAVLLLAAPLGAQTTAVTATISDFPDGRSWANGTWSATLISTGHPPTINGIAVSPTTASGTMNSSGALSVTLASNPSITPAGSQWQFTLCSNTTVANCSTISVTVSGSSINLSAALSSAANSPRFPAIPGARGYADVEVAPAPASAAAQPIPGATYLNVLTGALRQWNGVTWQDIPGAGGGTGCVPSGSVGAILISGAGGTCTGTPSDYGITTPDSFTFAPTAGSFDVDAPSGSINLQAGTGSGSSTSSNVNIESDAAVSIQGFLGSVDIQAGHGSGTTGNNLNLEGNSVVLLGDNGNVSLQQTGTGQFTLDAAGTMDLSTAADMNLSATTHLVLASADITDPGSGTAAICITSSGFLTTISCPAGGGGSIAHTFNILSGDNTGNAIASPMGSNGTVIISTLPLASGTPTALPTGVPTFLASVGDTGSGSGGIIVQEAEDGATNQKIWDSVILSGVLNFRAVNDAYSAASSWLTVSRTGTTITSIVFPTLADSALGAGNCVQAGTGGVLTTTASPCGGAGVTSVGLSLPAIFNVSGSPVTSTGTLTAALMGQSAHQVFIGPASGSASTPTFRSLVIADLPTAIPNANLAAQTANTVLGALTATTPSGLAMPSCSGATNALKWTSGTGFGCNTITPGTGTVTTSGSPILDFVPLFSGSTVIGNSHIDDGATTASTVTITENVVVNTGGPVNSGQLGTNVFSALPTCTSGVEGTWAPVTDSTTATGGATITGSGSNHVLGYCNGTNWVVL